MDGVAVLAGLTFLGVLFDGLTRFAHMPHCILSYSLMEGARYYGIGNEYMGAFLAATALAATAGFRRESSPLPLLVYAVCALLSEPNRRREMSARGRRAVDAKGASRVAARLVARADERSAMR